MKQLVFVLVREIHRKCQCLLFEIQEEFWTDISYFSESAESFRACTVNQWISKGHERSPFLLFPLAATTGTGRSKLLSSDCSVADDAVLLPFNTGGSCSVNSVESSVSSFASVLMWFGLIDVLLLLLLQLFVLLAMLFDSVGVICADVTFNSPSISSSPPPTLDSLSVTTSVLFSSAVLSASSVTVVVVMIESSPFSPFTVSTTVVDEVIDAVGIPSNRSGCSCVASECVHNANSTLKKSKFSDAKRKRIVHQNSELVLQCVYVLVRCPYRINVIIFFGVQTGHSRLNVLHEF